MEGKRPDAQLKGQPWRAWAPYYEVTDKYGPDGKLVSTLKTRRYTDWPNKRDIWNVLIGAAAVVILGIIAGLPV